MQSSKCPGCAFGIRLLVFQSLHIFHIAYNHQRNLKCDGILEYAKIQSGTLLEFIQTIYQSITMNIKLSGCLGYIQAVLKELVDCDQSLLIKVIRGLAAENLLDKHLAQRDRKLIDQTADSREL